MGSKPNVNLRDAYVTSDNIYFAQTALKLGLDKFNSGLKQFGFNQKMPVNYPFETSKIAGDQDIKDEGVLANSGYGQGETASESSPLGIDVYIDCKRWKHSKAYSYER